MAGNPKLIDKLYSSLVPEVVSLLRAAVAVADERGERGYLAGGAVRDLLRGEGPVDVDVVVEGDAVFVAREVACRTGVTLRKVSRFGTATLVSETSHVDLVSARRERYPRPGSLPVVEAGSIDSDLRRRDFSVNAMAIALSGSEPGEVIDPTGGRGDLQAGVIRVLHERSFLDDPTRMLRAVRYEQRFGFCIEDQTLGLLTRNVSALATVSGTRIRGEIERTFREERPELALARMNALGILRAVHPALSFKPDQSQALHELRSSTLDSLVARWGILCWGLDADDAGNVATRLALTRSQRAGVEALPPLRSASRSITADSKPSEVAATFRDFPIASVAALACAGEGEAVRRRARDFLERYRHVQSRLRGDDVVALGVARGPEIGAVLDQLRDLRLDGRVRTRADEEEYVRRTVGGRDAAHV